jgi:hypothetical protein
MLYWKHKIYDKMHREKLYNLQTEIYFNCLLFAVKKQQNSVRPIFEIVKEVIFWHERECCFLIFSYNHLICFLWKNQNLPQNAEWKSLHFTKNSLFCSGNYYAQKNIKISETDFRGRKNSSHRVLQFFENKK